ncbi:MAG: type IX secretion system membrane protein PorP/SprF [Salinivirgaceae bacterium]|jgi:hypothetical protein|nr:type IX secretion system membrane protein PorP/SprF [Bacteroidales bacterium]
MRIKLVLIYLKRVFIILFLSFIYTNIRCQERFNLIFSEQSHFFNPALASISEENRYSIGLSNQGLGYLKLSNLYAQLNYYSRDLNGGLEGYVVSYKEGIMRHNLISFNFSKNFRITKKWSLSLGFAPDFHNYTINSDDIILESQLLNNDNSGVFFPIIWTTNLSCGIAAFCEKHSIGFSVQNIFKQKQFKNSINNCKNPPQIKLTFSVGSIFDLRPYNNPSSKIYLRPHFVTVFDGAEYAFYYGMFYGSLKNQFGMFFVSTPNNILLGISPAFMTKYKSLKIILSLKIFPNLPSLYMFGNEVVMKGLWRT